MNRPLYFDAIAATRPSRQAILAAFSYYEEKYASPASPHTLGQEVLLDAKKGYAELYELFSADPADHFVFTSSGAEAVSQMIYSVYQEIVKKQGKNHFVCREIDEAPFILSCSRLEEDACKLRLAKVSSNGYITPDALIDAIGPRTALVSCQLASALTGVVQPVDEIAAICKERGILFHLDITHCIGKMPISLKDLSCDFVSFNAEQFHGLRGSGGLFIKKGAPYTPLIPSAPLNIALFRSLVEAVRTAKEELMSFCTEVAQLRGMLEERLAADCPQTHVLFQNEERLSHVSCICFPGVKSDALAFALNRKGLYASIGGENLQHIQRVLEACGVPKSQASCALSFSLSKDTQEQDIERATILVKECLERLRKTTTN